MDIRIGLWVAKQHGVRFRAKLATIDLKLFPEPYMAFATICVIPSGYAAGSSEERSGDVCQRMKNQVVDGICDYLLRLATFSTSHHGRIPTSKGQIVINTMSKSEELKLGTFISVIIRSQIWPFVVVMYSYESSENATRKAPFILCFSPSWSSLLSYIRHSSITSADYKHMN